MTKNLPPSWQSAEPLTIACTGPRPSASYFLRTTRKATSGPRSRTSSSSDVVDEVIVVDNNSRDGTADEARQTRARVVQESRQGYGHALQRGLREATGDIVIMAEPDGTFIGRDVLKLLAYADDFDMVCGTRTTRELVWEQANMGWFLRIGNWTVAKMIQFLYGGPSLSDCGCTLRLTHRAALEQIRDDLTVGGSHFLPEMVILALKRSLKIIEVPVNYRGRVGESKITGNLKGTLDDRLPDDRHDHQVPVLRREPFLNARQVTGKCRRRFATGLTPWAIVGLAAILPYLPTINDYFVRDDFGVVQLLAQKPFSYFPALVRDLVDGRHLGLLPGRSPAVSRRCPTSSPRSGGPVSPFLHHALNILIHAANGLLVMAIARARRPRRAARRCWPALVFVLLPVQAESVAWITGRVDSMPALFYLASFLAYVRYRQESGVTLSMVGRSSLFFVALFSKQNTITMVATLAGYDVIVGRRRILPLFAFMAFLRPYVPFVVMTAAYLWLRYLLFGQVAREGALNARGLEDFAVLLGRHTRHVVAGDMHASVIVVWLALAIIVAVWLAARGGRPRADTTSGSRDLGRRLLYFGPVWWAIGVLPIAVAGYHSPRHVYLAAVGWAIVLGIAFEAAWSARPSLRVATRGRRERRARAAVLHRAALPIDC